jgi:hypothetical protein
MFIFSQYLTIKKSMIKYEIATIAQHTETCCILMQNTHTHTYIYIYTSINIQKQEEMKKKEYSE